MASVLPGERSYTTMLPQVTSSFYCKRLGIWAVFLVLCTLSRQALGKHECFADVNGPKDDPNNIYKCEDVEKCCQEEGVPSCCREKEQSVAIWEQVELWGMLAVAILILAFVMWYCRHDGDCCGNKKGEEDKPFCGFCGGNKDEDDEIEETMGYDDDDDDYYEHERDRSQNDDGDTPGPAVYNAPDSDQTPGPAVYDLPDEKKYPGPRKEDIPEEFREVDIEKAA